jgi:polyphosphate kinase 2 (PPK2 family)
VLKAELKRDNLLMLQLGVAKELGYTLIRLKSELTMEELLLWSAYFDVTNEEQERRMKQRR